jgi:alkylated DNA repair dioxygenase AlkB
MEPVIKNIMALQDNKDHGPISEIVKGFEPVEVNVLEYHSERGSNIAPHMDDFWLWGQRIFGLNLLADTVMTFTKGNMEIEIPVKRRQLYLISGASRLEWMHGIKAEHITG